MSDYGIGQRIGAAGNQAANVLQGSWRAIAEGQVSSETIADIYADLLQSFYAAMSAVEAASVMGRELGATPAPQQFAPVQPVQPVPEPGGFASQMPQQQAPAFQPANVPGPQFQPVPQQQPGPFDAAAGQPQTQYQPVPQMAQAPGVPAQKPKVDDLWNIFFQDPSAWFDNRQDKANGFSVDRQGNRREVKPNAPDFKHRKEDWSLWLQGKYPAPAWVLQQFGLS